MALRLADAEPRPYEYVCTPTGDEPDEMFAHWRMLGEILGSPIRPVTGRHSLDGLIQIQQALPNWRMRWCTRMLKIEPFERYVINAAPCTVYVGIRADEMDREGVDYNTSTGGLVTHDFPLRRWGWGLGCVLDYLKQWGIEIPERTDCESCFFQTLYEWYVLWSRRPEKYAKYEGWEAMTGHTLRSDQRDTHPAALAGLRQEFESGYVPKKRTMKDRKVMCGVCAR